MQAYRSENPNKLKDLLDEVITYDGDYLQKEGVLNDYELYYIPDLNDESFFNYVMIIPEYLNCWMDGFKYYLFKDNDKDIKEACKVQDIFSFDEIKYMYAEEEEEEEAY